MTVFDVADEGVDPAGEVSHHLMLCYYFQCFYKVTRLKIHCFLLRVEAAVSNAAFKLCHEDFEKSLHQKSPAHLSHQNKTKITKIKVSQIHDIVLVMPIA